MILTLQQTNQSEDRHHTVTPDTRTRMRKFVKVIVLAFLATIVDAAFYDVTTIYRLSEDDIDLGLRSTGEYHVSNCTPPISDNSCKNWKKKTGSIGVVQELIFNSGPLIASSNTSCLSLVFYAKVGITTMFYVYTSSYDHNETTASTTIVGSITTKKLAVGQFYTWFLMINLEERQYENFQIGIAYFDHEISLKEITSGCHQSKGHKNVILNKVNTFEVHARTNAIAMPFMMPDKQVKNPIVGIDITECSSENNNCNWSKTNWRKNSNIHIPAPSSMTNATANKKVFTYSNNLFWSAPIRSSFSFTFKPYQVSNNQGSLSIFLMDSSDTLDYAEAILIQLKTGYYSASSTINFCGGSYRNNGIAIHENKAIYCRQMSGFDTRIKTDWKVDQESTWKISLTDAWIIVYDNKDNEVTKYQYKDGTFTKVLTRISFASLYMGGTVSICNDVYSLSNVSGSLTSPTFKSTGNQVCVVCEHFSDGNSTNLQAKVVTANGDVAMFKQTVPGITTNESGWIRSRFTASIANISQPIQVAIEGQQQDNSELYVSRISGCNGEDFEDIGVYETDTPVLLEYGVDVASLKQTNNNAFSKMNCSNGGKKSASNDICICPAGYTGATCEESCGANRYGNDCKGVCSHLTRGCRGMILCRQHIGCDCAPGLFGTLCLTACRGGSYGAGCKSKCGECLGGSCDVYTGACDQGCAPGYYPPLCQAYYTYMLNKPKVALDGFTVVKVEFDFERLSGFGEPVYYQLQYHDDDDDSWLEVRPKKYTGNTVHAESLTDLTPEKVYHVRAVLINSDGGSYTGSNIPVTEFQMGCMVPAKVDYKMKVVKVGDNYFDVQWMFPSAESTWCAVTKFELHVKVGWRWIVHTVTSYTLQHRIKDLLAGVNYKIKVSAVTDKGNVHFSDPIEIIIPEQAPERVVGLKFEEVTSQGVVISWEPPRFTAGVVRNYQVSYQCLDLLACPSTECKESSGLFKVRTSRARLEGLLSFARYNISVSAVSGTEGPTFSILTITQTSTPTVRPSRKEYPVTNRTNSGFSVSWDPPNTCTDLHGFLIGYRYQLFYPGQEVPLIDESTEETSHLFSDLEPFVNYTVRVYALTYAGWNREHYLTISTRTRASTPDTVTDLTAYKMGRRMIGLRWDKSVSSSGTLVSFTVTHHVDGETDMVKVKVTPTRCTAWPQHFCHTINELTPDQLYHITVQARNSEVDEDGEGVSISAATRETAPSAPTYLKVINKTDESLTIEWGLPNLINGQLRSFLINIEETDSINSMDCCAYFPLREVVVKGEDAHYQFQLNDLRAASSYAVSVSGKTVVLGVALSVTAYTRPSIPTMQTSPLLKQNQTRVGEQITVNVDLAADVHSKLNGMYLLLAVPMHAGYPHQQIIWNNWLSEEFTSKINDTYFLLAEWTQMSRATEINMMATREVSDGLFGQINTPILSHPDRYQLVQVLVLNYQGAFNMGFIRGEELTIVE